MNLDNEGMEYYPWKGEFTSCSPNSSVAIVLLNTKYKPNKDVAIYGHLKTENIGIEKIVANVISNPNIRFLMVCGDEIQGHCSGASLIALNKKGIDENNRIVDAPGAIPYIENLKKEAIDRFRSQVEMVDLIGINKDNKIDEVVEEYLSKTISPFEDSYIAVKISENKKLDISDKRALHSKIIVDYMGNVKKRGE